jgi:cellulose synthase (UDP-forming)
MARIDVSSRPSRRWWTALAVHTHRTTHAPTLAHAEPRTRAVEVPRVQFHRTMSGGETVVFAVLLAIVLALTARYAWWWLQPGRVPTNYRGGVVAFAFVANVLPFLALTVLEALRTLQLLVFWVFATVMAQAVPMPPPRGMRVAVLTTIVPSKEPPEAVEATLAGMSRIRHDGPLDLWILDEEDDPRVRVLAAAYGVRHFSRAGIEAYNQPSGPFAAKTKAGNLNAWRDQHEDAYDVVGQMDSDHVPTPDFLERTLGYFADPDVAYVVAPQVYQRNAARNWIARGADEQNFGFSAITQRGGNRLAMPIFIGSNHLCRTATMRQIGGYVSHVVEDHITGMVMLSRRNATTGNHWKGVYADAIISHGEGPTSWGSYLAQQMRWSYGLFEILRRHSPRLLWRMRPQQVVGLLLIQSYYPSVATVFVLGVVLTALHLFTGMNAVNAPLGEWVSRWVPPFLASMVLWYWMQRFYLTRADRGVGLRGMLLGAGAALIYVRAMLRALAGKPLAYVITPKGQAGTREPITMFRWHLVIAAVSLAALAWSLAGWGGASWMLRGWSVFTVALLGIVVVSARLAAPEGGRVRAQRGGNYWLRVGVTGGALLASLTAPALLDASDAANEAVTTSSADVVLLPPAPSQLLLATPGEASDVVHRTDAIEARAPAANASRAR